MTDPFFWLDSHNAIIGTSDAGKTWTAKWGVEELLRQHRHVLIWDPLGVWYGLRSSANGRGPGFDIPIFGGPHGDVPITAADGAAIARIVTEQRVSAIVDVSLITNGPDQRRFARDLVAQLRRRRDRANFHFVVDEADELVPEKTRDDVGFALQEDMLWIAKKGRASGWVQTLITQRTADIAKSSLSMSQTIIAHQLVSPQDQKPFVDWVRTKGSKAELAEIESRLASLQRGERYLYSPRAHVLELAVTPPITTFDSSRTPPAGEKRREPRTLAQLDVSAIKAALAKPVEDLKAAIATAKPVSITPIDTATRVRIAHLEEKAAAALRVADEAYARGVNAGIGIGLARARSAIDALRIPDLAASAAAPASQAKAGAETPPKAPAAVKPVSRAEEATAPSVGADINLKRGRKALLPLANIHPAGATEAQWATMARLSKSGGTWGTYKGALRAAGLIEQRDGMWYATAAGVATIGGEREPLPAPGADRARFWGDRIPGVRRMVDVLVKRSPHLVTREALAADLGMSAAGGTFGSYLGRLRANGLLEEHGKRLRLHPDVMENS